jgi:hypothetical protein
MATRIKATELAYMAGIIDGEGTICITKTNGGTRSIAKNFDVLVVVNMTRPTPLDFIAKRFGGTVTRRERGSKNYAAIFRWFACANRARKFLMAIRPFLHLKCKQADIALKYLTLKRGRKGSTPLTKAIIAAREKLYLRCKKLNRRGVSVGNLQS